MRGVLRHHGAGTSSHVYSSLTSIAVLCTCCQHDVNIILESYLIISVCIGRFAAQMAEDGNIAVERLVGQWLRLLRQRRQQEYRRSECEGQSWTTMRRKSR